MLRLTDDHDSNLATQCINEFFTGNGYTIIQSKIKDVDGYSNLFALQDFTGQNLVNMSNWNISYQKTKKAMILLFKIIR